MACVSNTPLSFMFENYDDYFDCVLAHYGSPFNVLLICEDTKMTPEEVIDELKKRGLLYLESRDGNQVN